MVTNEPSRLDTLRLYDLLDTASEDAFDRLVKLAAVVCEKPISLVSLVDEKRQWFKARIGLDAQETERQHAFCSHAIEQDDVFIVEDTHTDPRFSNNPLVTDDPNIRFYAGAPLTMANGHNIGTLCVIDSQPDKLSSVKQESLETIRDAVVSLIEYRRKAERLSEMESLLPLCAWCHSVKDNGEWSLLADYVQEMTPVTHGICPRCADFETRGRTT